MCIAAFERHATVGCPSPMLRIASAIQLKSSRSILSKIRFFKFNMIRFKVNTLSIATLQFDAIFVCYDFSFASIYM